MVYPEAINITGIKGLLQYADSVTGGWFGISMIVSFFVVISVTLLYSTKNPYRSFATSTYLTAILTILMSAMGLISDLVLIVSIVLFFFAGLILFMTKEKD